MRMTATLFCVCVIFLGPAWPAQDTGETSFARCSKILKFGQVNDFFKPMKQDAVLALGLLGDQRAVPLLLEHLQNEDDEHLQFQIVRALGWLKSAKAVVALEKMSKNQKRNLRDIAIVALEEITGKDYGWKQRVAHPLPALEELLRELGGAKPGVDALFGKGFVEVGKTYRFVFARAGAKDVVADLMESPRDGWARLRIQQGEESTVSWINLAAVAMILPASEKK